MDIKALKSAVKRASTLSQLNLILNAYLSNLNIKTFSFTYYAAFPKANQKPKYEYTSDNFKLWHEHFVEENYDYVDSTMDELYHSIIPVTWNIQDQIANAKSNREKEMRLNSLEFGADKGVCIPLRGPNDEFANLMVEQMQGETCMEHLPQIQDQLFIAGQYYFHYIRKLLLKSLKARSSEYSLSKREIQCLNLLAQKLSVSEMAKKLNITERTVNYHIQRINKKFGVKSKYQSVSEAEKLGLITL